MKQIFFRHCCKINSVLKYIIGFRQFTNKYYGLEVKIFNPPEILAGLQPPQNPPMNTQLKTATV